MGTVDPQFDAFLLGIETDLQLHVLDNGFVDIRPLFFEWCISITRMSKQIVANSQAAAHL